MTASSEPLRIADGHDVIGADRHGFASSRIALHSRVAPPLRDDADAGDSHAIAAPHNARHGLRDLVERDLRLDPGQAGALEFVDDVIFHFFSSGVGMPIRHSLSFSWTSLSRSTSAASSAG